MKNKFYFLILLPLLLLFSFNVANAADIFCISSKLNVNTNQTFTVTLNTNTKGVYINNIEGVLSFPKDLLSAESVSISGSIFSMWVEQPRLSNITGTVSFNGGIPTPGFIGTNGKILSVVFRAKKAGVANLSFSSANIYANDGMGTDITGGKSGINITITTPTTPKEEKKVVPVKKVEIDTIAPKDLKISSYITSEDIVVLKISSSDDDSGLDKYKISIDDVLFGDFFITENPTEVILSPQKAGKHKVSVIAYDKMGNLSEEVVAIEFPIVKIPEIINYPKSIKKGENIKISGTSYLNTDVKIYLQIEGEEEKNYIVKTDDDGSFTFTTDFIEQPGLASFWTETIRTPEIISETSQKYFIVVNKPAFIKISLWMIQLLSVVIPIILLIIVIILLVHQAHHKVKKFRRKLMIDLEQTEGEAHKIFRIMKEDIKEITKIFKRKEIKDKLTKCDQDTIDSVSRDVEEAEEYFTKRIKSIEQKDL
ncbi:MAG: cohesin domain-containing protein [Candidatus Paceibacterota bacterium]